MKTTSRTRRIEPCWTRIPFCWPALAGFFCGLIFSSIPVGPINLTILNEGAQRGFLWAMLIGLGAIDDGDDLLHDFVHRLFLVL